MISNSNTIYGTVLKDSKIPGMIRKPVVRIPYVSEGIRRSLEIDMDILSKHILMMGGIGSGKTNVFYYIVDAVKKNMSANDVMIIFDTKGDYIKEFYMENDIVIANTNLNRHYAAVWNIYREIVADGFEEKKIIENTREIVNVLFKPIIEANNNQKFFSMAACDILSAILIAQIRIGKDNLQYKRKFFNNKALSDYLSNLNANEINILLSPFRDLSAVLAYIGDGSSDQALGVIAELLMVIRPILIGNFAEKGFFSIRDFVRKKGGRTLFLEYDLAAGEVLTPIYRLLFDLALKEALGQNRTYGNVYFICDEFKLLPNLQHIEDGINFGRSLGVKVVAGIQSIEQLYHIYGKSKGNSIASGFSTIIAFNTKDAVSRQYITDTFGKNMVLDRYQGHDGKIVEEKRIGNVVEDWELIHLRVGDAVVGLPFQPPFMVHFEKFGEKYGQ